MGLGEGFKGKSEQSVVDTMETADIIDVISDFPSEMRPRLGIPEDERPSDPWRDITGTGHLYVRGALASLERISKKAHDPEAAAAAIGTVIYAKKNPEKFYGSTAEQCGQIAQKILLAEQNEEGDINQIVSRTDMAALMGGLGDAKDTIDHLAKEKPSNDIKVYSAALDRVNEHYKAFSAYLTQRLDKDPGPEIGGLDDVS